MGGSYPLVIVLVNDKTPNFSIMLSDSVWVEKYKYDDAEEKYFTLLAKCNISSGGTIADKIASCRQHIQKSLGEVETGAPAKSKVQDNDVANKITDLQKENVALKKAVEDLTKTMQNVLTRLTALESTKKDQKDPPTQQKTEAPKKEEEEDDDDVDLFGSDSEEEDEEAKQEREKKLAAYAAKKAKKPGPIAKSNVIFDVKPWDDETNMQEMEKLVRTVATDGLLWGASKLVPLAYGIKKLQISCVVEDEKVSIDWVQETIEEFEDVVQSVDIAAFNKI